MSVETQREIVGPQCLSRGEVRHTTRATAGHHSNFYHLLRAAVVENGDSALI